MAAGQATELSAALLEVFRDCNVHEALRQALQQQELLSVEDFAYAFPTLSHLDSLFSNLEEDVKSSLSITDAASSVPAVALPAQTAQALSIATYRPNSRQKPLKQCGTPSSSIILVCC